MGGWGEQAHIQLSRHRRPCSYLTAVSLLRPWHALLVSFVDLFRGPFYSLSLDGPCPTVCQAWNSHSNSSPSCPSLFTINGNPPFPKHWYWATAGLGMARAEQPRAGHRVASCPNSRVQKGREDSALTRASVCIQRDIIQLNLFIRYSKVL